MLKKKKKIPPPPLCEISHTFWYSSSLSDNDKKGPYPLHIPAPYILPHEQVQLIFFGDYDASNDATNTTIYLSELVLLSFIF